MEHLDEGTVHAWLDGALSPDEGKRIEEHMGTCADCSALVAEARGLIAASARILSSLDEVPRVQVESGARDAAIAGELQDALQRARRSANATVPTVEARQISVPRIARRPWWARPQLSAAAVLAVVALGSLVVTRNKDRALPNALKVPPAAPALPAPTVDAGASQAMDSAVPPTAAPSAAPAESQNAPRRERAPNDAATGSATGAPARAKVAVDALDKRTFIERRVARDAKDEASARGAVANIAVTPPPVAPPVVAAKALADSATTLSAREASAMRKSARASSQASAAADAIAAQRADSARDTTQSQLKRLSRAIDPNAAAIIEKRRIVGEPKLEAVVTTGAASANSLVNRSQLKYVVKCWSLERTAAAREGGVPEQIELTSSVVGNENGRPVYAAHALPRSKAKADINGGWRWMIGVFGDVLIVRGSDAAAPRFPIAMTKAEITPETSAAKSFRCDAR